MAKSSSKASKASVSSSKQPSQRTRKLHNRRVIEAELKAQALKQRAAAEVRPAKHHTSADSAPATRTIARAADRERIAAEFRAEEPVQGPPGSLLASLAASLTGGMKN